MDATEADRLPELLAMARQRALSAKEVKVLAEALRRYEPWLEWSGKREKPWFEVEPVALHMHERISTQAILRVPAREDVERDLFADPQLDYAKAVQFYQHDVDWANRMILGDSLQVMASLARREDLAGKVQTIYLDPPYGIKFASNFQPQLGQRDVKDREQDLTREPEMVKAYRDTWNLGIHPFAYLRDRLADYDGWTFCICQAFFPDKSKWAKLARALGDVGAVEEDAFAALSGLNAWAQASELLVQERTFGQRAATDGVSRGRGTRRSSPGERAAR
jgi:hypothetical protein